MTACKYWDCGWCYAPNYLKTNAVNSTCVNPYKCPISPLSEPVQYETPMTENEEEIEKVKAQIKVLEKKLSFLEELEKTKSPVEEAYKRWMGEYPLTGPSVDSIDDIRWRAFQMGYNAAYEEKVDGEPEEQVSFVPKEIKELVKEGLKWCKEHPNESVEDYLTPKTPEKRKIDDLAEKLLPDDHPYKITDEHGETNPYKQYLNSVEDEKKMEELGFAKNSEGHWTAQPLVETAQEQVKKLQEKDWDIQVETDYRTGKARHKTRVVDKDGDDYKPEPLTTEELLKPKWEPKPQSEEEVADGLKEAFVEAQQTEKWKEIQKLIDEEDNDKNFKNSLDLIREWGENNKPPTLKELLWEWWEDIFTVDADLDADASIDVLVDRIEEFLPKEHDTNDYQWNKCLKMIKSKLR